MWREPTEDDIIASISQAELDSYKRSANWEADPVDILCQRAAAYARDHIRSNPRIILSPNAHEIPESCISPAMDYLAVDVCKRIGQAATEERKEARKEAIDFFKRIAEGKLIVESYGAEENQSATGAAAEIIKESRSKMTPEKLEGL